MDRRSAIADVNGDGQPDILFTVEDVDCRVHKAFSRPLVGWKISAIAFRSAGKIAIIAYGTAIRIQSKS